jgi:hypothetical protein
LVVNLTSRSERCGPAEKKKFSRLRARSRLRHLHDVDQARYKYLIPPVFAPFVDKLLNIHRIECAEVPRNATTNFLSSFDPLQKQGLFDRFRRS